MGSSTDILLRDAERWAKVTAERAVQAMNFSTNELAVPKDRGVLQQNIKTTSAGWSGDTFTAVIRPTAKSADGFDYPAYINTVKVILPRHAKYLSWIDSGGGRVFATKVVNPNKGWWNKARPSIKKAWKSAVQAGM